MPAIPSKPAKTAKLKLTRKVTVSAPAAKTAKPAKAAAPKATASNVAKPSMPRHDYKLPQGVSGLNARASRTSINFKAFGSLPNAHLTDRDNKNIAALKGEFGKGPFQRGNIDSGVLRRLGERGIIAHVSGSDVDPQATFRFVK